jgi:hypothetical protein
MPVLLSAQTNNTGARLAFRREGNGAFLPRTALPVLVLVLSALAVLFALCSSLPAFQFQHCSASSAFPTITFRAFPSFCFSLRSIFSASLLTGHSIFLSFSSGLRFSGSNF